MNHLARLSLIACLASSMLIAGLGLESAQAQDDSPLQRDLAALRAYDFGAPRAPLVRLRQLAADPKQRTALESAYLELVTSDAATAGARDFCVRELVVIAGDASTPVFASLLLDELMHDDARRVLEAVATPEAFAALADALHRAEQPRHLVGLIESLARSGDAARVGDVAPFSDHDDEAVAKAALNAVGVLGAPRDFLPAVKGRELPYLEGVAHSISRRLDGQNRRRLAQLLPSLLAEAKGDQPWQVLGLTVWFDLSPETAIETVARWVDLEPRLGREAAIGLLRRLPADDPVLDTAIRRLLVQEQRHPQLVLDLLVKRGLAANEVLRQRLRSEDVSRRLGALEALVDGTIDDQTTDVVLRIAAQSRGGERAAARRAIERARGSVNDRLAAVLRSDPEWDVRAEAARVLGRRGGTIEVAALLDALGDGNSRVRVAAWEAIGRVAGEAEYPQLCRKLFGTFTSRERTVAARSLVAIARRTDPPYTGSAPEEWTSILTSDDATGEWTEVGGVTLSADDDRRFDSEPGTGVWTNGATGRTTHWVSEHQHADVWAHIEFTVPRGSNSGVYFMGRYEVQVLDSFGRESVAFSDCGGIYQRWDNGRGFEGHAPASNASKPPGEWQRFEVIFRAPEFGPDGTKLADARFERVLLNGEPLHEMVPVTGPTRAALFADEAPLGPLMLQGDHGPVAYRNVRVGAIPSRQDVRALPLLRAARACEPETLEALRPILFDILAELGGRVAFDHLSERATSDDLDVQRAALRALAEWPGPEAFDLLMAAIRQDPGSKLAVVALRGVLQQVAGSRSTDARKLEQYREVAALATTVDARRSLLTGLGKLERVEALELIAPHLDSEETKVEAALAGLTICESILPTHPDVVGVWIDRLEPIVALTPDQRRMNVLRAGLALLAAVIPQWQLAGPYQRANTTGHDLIAVEFPPETDDPAVAWRTVRATRGQVDLDALLDGSHRCAYLEAIVHAEADTPARIDLGSDDGNVVWLNGEKVHENAASRPYSLGDDRIEVQLRAGANRLLIKVTQLGGGWAAGARVVAPDGSAIPGVTFGVR